MAIGLPERPEARPHGAAGAVLGRGGAELGDGAAPSGAAELGLPVPWGGCGFGSVDSGWHWTGGETSSCSQPVWDCAGGPNSLLELCG